MTVRVLVPHRISPRGPGNAPVRRLAGRSMGCAWHVAYADTGGLRSDGIAQGIQSVLRRVVDQMSTWEPDSVITRFNRAGRGSWLPLPVEFATVLACALRICDATGGALDPTAGDLINLWGFGSPNRHRQPGFMPPTAAEVAAVCRPRNWERLEVDAVTMRIFQPGTLQLDLSAVAKGYAVDAVSRYLHAQGLEHHLVDIGGELRGAGMKPDSAPWWVDVQPPTRAAAVAPTRIALHDMAVATSGDYVQDFQDAGRHYSHCIDPRHGQPIDNGVASVTVLHAQCMEADAWSTALMVLGVRDGLPLAEQRDLAARWCVRVDGRIEEFSTRAFRSMIVGVP